MPASKPEDAASTLRARPIPVSPAAPPAAPQTTLLTVAAVVAILYLGRDLLVPFALAVLLSFVLSPIVSRLERWRIPRIPAVVMVVVLVFALVTAFGSVVGSQIADLAENLPTYERNIRAKIQALGDQAGAGGGMLGQASEMVRGLREELDRVADQAEAPAPGPDGRASPEPVPVRVAPPDAEPLEVLQRVLGPVLAPLAMVGMVLVFTIFMLLQREDLRDRLIRLVGSGDLSRTTAAMSDAGKRVSRYLLMQVAVNVTYGIPIGAGLALLGVPNPILWGVLATVLRFIPFVGPVIAASFPILLSFAVDPGWTLPLLTVALFLAVELFSNNVVEPWLYGTATGLSSVAIIVVALFWTMLWGPVGLLLATPLTVCLVVIGRYVPHLRFLEVMFGDHPVLPDEAKIYQRLLARDPEEAVEICEELLAERSMIELYDEVLLAALSLAEQDRQRGHLDAEGRAAVARGVAGMLDELADVDAPDPGPAVAGLVLSIGARNDLDEMAAALLSDLLRRHGTESTTLPCEAVGPRAIAEVPRDGVRAVVLSYLNPSALPHARRLARRLRRHFGPRVPIVLGLWSAHPEARASDHAIAETAADGAISNLAGAIAHLERLGFEADRAA
ncbi:AI-2E family transporter [Azospirillum sp. ST 5-10]|uniref:AI-2E family transporter n=1 Tax=unclassified Azospirillum TaxID=2630922 RepID=UPI003F4A36B3